MSEPFELLSIELRTIISVAELSSFGRVARELNVQPSTVSRRVRNVEDAVGVSLFERHADGVVLTAAGAAFVDRLVHSRNILQAAIADAQHAGAAGNGALRLGFVWSFAAGAAREIIAAFREEHPGIRLHLTELGAAELLKRTLTREIDCAWIVKWRDLDPALEQEALWSEALHLAQPVRDASGKPQDWSVLARQPYLCRTTDDWRLFQATLDLVNGPKMDIRSHDCSHDSLLSLVAAGDGITLMPESIAHQGHAGVQFSPMSDPRGRLEIISIWRRETDNPALRRFMSFSRGWLKKNQSWPPTSSSPA